MRAMTNNNTDSNTNSNTNSNTTDNNKPICVDEEAKTTHHQTEHKEKHRREHPSLGKVITIRGSVQELAERLKNSPDCWTIPKPKGQDQLIRKLTGGRF